MLFEFNLPSDPQSRYAWRSDLGTGTTFYAAQSLTLHYIHHSLEALTRSEINQSYNKARIGNIVSQFLLHGHNLVNQLGESDNPRDLDSWGWGMLNEAILYSAANCLNIKDDKDSPVLIVTSSPIVDRLRGTDFTFSLNGQIFRIDVTTSRNPKTNISNMDLILGTYEWRTLIQSVLSDRSREYTFVPSDFCYLTRYLLDKKTCEKALDSIAKANMSNRNISLLILKCLTFPDA